MEIEQWFFFSTAIPRPVTIFQSLTKKRPTMGGDETTILNKPNDM